MWLEPGELRTLARYLSTTVGDLRRRLPISYDSEAEAEYVEVGPEGCPLLDARGTCTVDAVKPSQCATFPFWPELLEDRAEMRRLCEGVDRPGAPLISARLMRGLARGDGRI